MPVTVEVSTCSVTQLLIDICAAVSRLHLTGWIHGDLKPDNILLTSQGVQLIDDFHIRSGEISPGWTPDWAAPEQALGRPVSFATDIYPFGYLITALVEGQLVGEVRKFKISVDGREQHEFDVFYNPSVRVPSDSCAGDARALRRWTELARRCLSFEPDLRPALQSIAAELRELAAICPLQGVRRIKLPEHLVRVSFMGGSVGLARRISASEQ